MGSGLSAKNQRHSERLADKCVVTYEYRPFVEGAIGL
jgi:hypothetical protein